MAKKAARRKESDTAAIIKIVLVFALLAGVVQLFLS